MFMKFLGGKVPPKGTIFFFYKRLQETVVDEGETMWTTLMDKQGLRQGDQRVQRKNLRQGEKKRQIRGLPHNRFFREGKRSFQTGLEKISLDLDEIDDDFLLMGYTVSKLKYFTRFRKYKGGWGRKHGKSYFGFKVC